MCAGKKRKTIPEGITLDQLIKNEQYMSDFQKYLTSIYCEENLFFYVAAIDYKVEPKQNKLESIINSYIMEDGDSPINFEFENERENLITKYTEVQGDKKPTSDFLDKIFEEVRMDLMSQLVKYYLR